MEMTREEAIKKIKDTIFVGNKAKYCFEIKSITKAPEPRCNLKGITEEDFWERAGYDRALRDCGVLDDDSN